MANLNTQSWMTHRTQAGVFMVNVFFLKFLDLIPPNFCMWGNSLRTLGMYGERPISNYFKAKITVVFVQTIP